MSAASELYLHAPADSVVVRALAGLTVVADPERDGGAEAVVEPDVGHDRVAVDRRARDREGRAARREGLDRRRVHVAKGVPPAEERPGDQWQATEGQRRLALHAERGGLHVGV